MSEVFRPVRIGELELKHRIVMGSMHMNLETVGDGSDLAAFYTERVRGGADLIVTGGIAVNRVGAGSASYAMLTEPDDVVRLALVAHEVHAAGGKIALQLFHAGRYAFEQAFGLTPVAPSAVYSRFSRCEPEAMGAGQIEQTIADFASGARNAVGAGFDAVEVMASEGYLLNQFASPLTNLRDDEWGGDAERRRRFPVAVMRAIRDAVDVPIIARTSGDDLMDGSSTADEHDSLAVALADAGADAVNVGIGWHESRTPTVQGLVPHGMWIDVAARVRDAVRDRGHAIPVIGSNRINSMVDAEAVLAADRVDLVSMARPFLADSAIVDKVGRPEFVNTCIGCNEACLDRSLGTERVSCLVNPRAGRELFFPLPDGVSGVSGGSADLAGSENSADSAGPADPADPVGHGNPVDSGDWVRRYAVVGAGPAGMQAALTLAGHGHAVDLFDAEPGIGGQFRLACRVPGKRDFGETIRFFENELPRLGVRIHLGRHVNADELAGYAHVIVATGVTPRTVDVPGSGLPHVMSYRQAFDRVDDVGERVAVIGAGGIAVDLAELLARPEESGIADGPAREKFAVAHGLDSTEVGNDAGSGDGGTRYAAESGNGGPRSAGSRGDGGAINDGRRDVTIMRRSGKVGAGIGPSMRWAVVSSIREAGVTTLTGVAYRHITAEGVWIGADWAQGTRGDGPQGDGAQSTGEDDADRLIAADTVVIAAGQVPRRELADDLAAAGIAHTVVGGSRDASGLNAVRAFGDALQAATALL